MHQNAALAGECKMGTDELLAELLQGLTNDVQKLKQQVAKLPTQGATDHRAELNRLSQEIQKISQQTGKADLSGISGQLNDIESKIRYTPQYRASTYIKYAGIAFVLLLPITVAATWYAFDFKQERDRYLSDNWRVRYVRQSSPDYYSEMEGYFKKEPEIVKKWIIEQEQADQKRELAREAADRAKELSNQANELEGKGKRK